MWYKYCVHVNVNRKKTYVETIPGMEECLNENGEFQEWLKEGVKGFQDGDKREEAESMLPKVKSWKDTADIPCRKNHQEEAKLQHLHNPSPSIASPLHIEQRNQEGSHTIKRQLLSCLGAAVHQVSKVAHGTPTDNPGPD
jgi:hypothetical protein